MRFFSFSALSIAASFVGLVSAAQGQLQQVSGNIGPNPNNVGMFVYRPSGLVANPALIVAVHYCSGSAQAYFTGTPYANLADQYKTFMVIFPNAPRSGGCFDVNTPQSLSHNGGGDSQGIASMVQYAITTYGVDASRVFITGLSSGAMMTNVMLGSYPNLFKAATAYAGVPFGCFSGGSDWSSQCATGQLIKTGAQWGDMVRAAYPGYTGPRPKFQFWHGTNDETLNYQNFKEEIKEWTNVFGVSETPTATTQNSPRSGVTKTTYGDSIVALSVAGATHNLPIDGDSDLLFFGLTGNSSPTGPPVTVNPPTTGLPTTTPPTSTPPPSNGPGANHWDQCGGNDWIGATSCVSPFTCTKINDWYSQCL